MNHNLFLVGDVHGCYHTFRELLGHWRPDEELLVQTGDLVDRGRFGPECVQLAMELEQQYPGRTVFLLGNHEYEMQKHFGPRGPNPAWLGWGGRATVQQYQGRADMLQHHLAWLAHRPFTWENNYVLVSHAGFADTDAPLDAENMDGVLWRRGPLQNMGRRQVVGHTPTPEGTPTFDAAANVLNIDTGACFGQNLTGMRLSFTGELLGQILIPTSLLDIVLA
ncbi:serine/threonine protein phosphatase [Hymenobacter sp. HSC-4F20]|uniref:metallophosphoesterase family protein n=1 Tax=Hymenobacter sp. HSC-4F20 TaxID=2864135 RepID=UPI001C72B5EC|nr:metallophosphoesterase family protein [Hymenobacter sp. HSC-4F20]MBX0288948.1 serine/threonine protein phosphatase [Hymenobacter sp. HSC-4F20]